ncbi:MAG: polysulfide reductase NrfD [Chloroflexi bacterium]|nr:polysulfide reductase NrfD [Chloroflexota bacterium]
MSSQSIPQQAPAPPLPRLGEITETVTNTIFGKAPLWWLIAFGISSALAGAFVLVLGAVALFGTGLWGINVPIVWGMGITNLVFWIGIGHAGTFISAFLLLMRQSWRNAFSRYAEAMTLFALATAGMFPLFHVGRPEWIFYFAPYPNTMILNPQWLSPLVWDAIAISTYGGISAIFWFLDLIPDIAAMRDKAKRPIPRAFYGFLALGWRSDSNHWERLHKTAYILAALATPLVISVHSVVGLDFAIGNLPGWHHSIFPPYFVAGAIFSGLAMTVIVGIVLRSGYEGLKDFITMDHIDKALKLMLITGLLVTYGYMAETFGGWYKADAFELPLIIERAIGPYAPFYLAMLFFNCILIQLLWFKPVRKNIALILVICVGILIGMWLERFVIVSVSLSYTYLAPTWEVFNFTFWDILTIFGPFGFFFAQFLVFIRFLPSLPISETQQHAVEVAHA